MCWENEHTHNACGLQARIPHSASVHIFGEEARGESQVAS